MEKVYRNGYEGGVTRKEVQYRTCSGLSRYERQRDGSLLPMQWVSHVTMTSGMDRGSVHTRTAGTRIRRLWRGVSMGLRRVIGVGSVGGRR